MIFRHLLYLPKRKKNLYFPLTCYRKLLVKPKCQPSRLYIYVKAFPERAAQDGITTDLRSWGGTETRCEAEPRAVKGAFPPE